MLARRLIHVLEIPMRNRYFSSLARFSFAIKTAAYFSILTGTTASFGHVVLAEQAAVANTSYRATLRVGHGCEGSPVTAVRVTIPDGFQGAKPMPHGGWVLTTLVGKFDEPYDNHGKSITTALLEIIDSSATGHAH